MNRLLSRRAFSTSSRRMALEMEKYVTNPYGEGHHANPGLWKKLTYLVALPVVVLVSIRVAIMEMSHEAHRPEFHPYPHMRIRTKPFPWGDGQRSLFHHPHFNALPDGYEDEE